MTQQELSKLTDDELIREAKKVKTGTVIDGVIIGMLIGVAVYSTVKNGWGLLTFLPLVYLPIAAKNKAKNKPLEDVLKERGLK